MDFQLLFLRTETFLVFPDSLIPRAIRDERVQAGLGLLLPGVCGVLWDHGSH